MYRRRLLSGCGTLLAGFLAGCPADSGGNSEPPTPTPSSQEGPAVSDGTPTVTPPPSPTPTETPRPTSTPTATTTPTPTPSVERRKVALGAYRAGFEEHTDYDRFTSVARNGFTNGKYQGAQLKYRDALEAAEASIPHFERARDIAAEVGKTRARRLADEAAGYTRQYLVPFAKLGIDAAEAAQAERFADAGDLIDEMETLSREARVSPLQVVTPTSFEYALDL